MKGQNIFFRIYQEFLCVILTLNCGRLVGKVSGVRLGQTETSSPPASWSGHPIRRIHHPHRQGQGEYKVEHECPNHTVAVELIIKTLTDPEVGVIKDMSVIKAGATGSSTAGTNSPRA
jgi:acetate kinase